MNRHFSHFHFALQNLPSIPKFYHAFELKWRALKNIIMRFYSNATPNIEDKLRIHSALGISGILKGNNAMR